MNVVLLIPAYNPPESFIDHLTNLIRSGFSKIVVVNDGSNPQRCDTLFSRIAAYPECHVISHPGNLGKGQALKTAFSYIIEHYPGCSGIVTADSDGQHLPDDIIKVARCLESHGESLVLGTRAFGKGTPARSLVGNVITRSFVHIVLGQRLTDTQTGLRGIPVSFLPTLLDVKGDRYEYEMGMLLATRACNIPIIEEQISTVYIDNNKSSNFHPLIDSMRIYYVLLRFAGSSLFASIVDFIIFVILFQLFHVVIIGLIGARIAASIVNYVINKNIVFHNKQGNLKPLVKYYLLSVTMMVVVYYMINLLHDFMRFPVLTAKVCAESLLFFVNFIIQRNVIFSEPPPKREPTA
ncbi:MAG: GtrA family protein [Armatimonadota bacterium]